MDPPSPGEYDDHFSDADSLVDVKEESSTNPHDASSSNPHSKPGSASKPGSHLQKRRRVTRACDECRRKKIKCDGKQPCTHCTVYSYECTYDQPSNRRRNPAPQYVESLEHRVYRAEALLHILFPNLDLNNPGIDAAVAQGWIPGAPGKGIPPAGDPTMSPEQPAAPAVADVNADTKLESMVRAVAQIELDDTGHWNYHGHSSGISFIKRMREQLGDMMGPEVHGTPFAKAMQVHHVLDSPKSSPDSPMTDSSFTHSALPPKGLARRICAIVMNDVLSLMRIVHQPSFWASFERIYSIPQDRYTNEDHLFLPVLYSAMALGSLFGTEDRPEDQEEYETALAQGLAYFKAARHMMDIADCRDLAHIQAVVFMIIFMQSTAKLSQCYAYIGIALRSACRMGLHRAAVGTFDPVEAETRKRLFWTIRNLDVYVGAMLGLPVTLRAEDIDQEYPLEVDDEYITRDGILPVPENTHSFMTAFNAHTRLVDIFPKIMRKIYPIQCPAPLGAGEKSYSIPFSSIREIESDLEAWKNSLPAFLSPSDDLGKHTRVQQLLRMSYAHAQVMLYRPFLHFVAMEKRAQAVDKRAYACAASFVNVSRNIIHIQTQMKQKGLLNGAYWFNIYTAFFSILALVYYAAENPDQPTHGVMKDATEGKEVLASLATRSMAADRCTMTLNIIFERLPSWLREGRQNPTISKKRSHNVGTEAGPGWIAGTQSSSDLAYSELDSKPSARRAATFPAINSPNPQHGNSPYDRPWPPPPPTSYGGPTTPTSGSFDMSNMNGFGQSGTSNPINGTLPQYAASRSYGNPALSEFSSMMFPAADEPFVYPNQPLTTFENNQQYVKSATAPNTQSAAVYGSLGTSTPPPGSSHAGEDIEAQFFALPPYIQQRMPTSAGMMQQRQHTAQQPQQATSADIGYGSLSGVPYSTGQTDPPTQAMNASADGWSSQNHYQPGLGNINIPELFGGNEWTAMAMGNAHFGNPGN